MRTTSEKEPNCSQQSVNIQTKVKKNQANKEFSIELLCNEIQSNQFGFFGFRFSAHVHWLKFGWSLCGNRNTVEKPFHDCLFFLFVCLLDVIFPFIRFFFLFRLPSFIRLHLFQHNHPNKKLNEIVN